MAISFKVRYDRSYLGMTPKISDKTYTISSTSMDVPLEVDMDTYALTLSSMPYALTGWKRGSDEYGVNETMTITGDMLTTDDNGTWLDVVGMYKSAYSIVIFTDTDGTVLMDDVADGKFKRVIRTKKEAVGLKLPAVYNGEDGTQIPKPDEIVISSEGHLDMVGWQDEDTGAITGSGAVLNITRRGVIVLKPIWKQVYNVPRIATVQFVTGERGTLLDENGEYKKGWEPSENPDNGILIKDGDVKGQGTFSFRIDSTVFKVPDTYPDYIPPLIEETGTMGQDRYMSHWIRVDGGAIVQSDNPTNKGFQFADGSAGLTEGDGYADIFYPGDIIPLRVGEVVTLRPVWIVAYKHTLIYDLTQAKPNEEDSAETIEKKNKYKDSIIEWMNLQGITPDYDDSGEFLWTGQWVHIGPKRMLWTRMPSTNPPFYTYFQIWVAESPMKDISQRYTYGGKKIKDVKAQYEHICSSIHDENIRNPPSLSVCGLQPCTSQRVGLLADGDSHSYSCNLVAVWNQWRGGDQSDFPNIAVVYEDPEWVEPVNDSIQNASSLSMPTSNWFTGVEYYDTTSNAYQLYLDVLLLGTGKQIFGSGMIDTRPRSGGEDISVKLFEDWSVRIGGFSSGVSHKVSAGSTIRISVTGNIMSSYYWGQFPGPGWIGGTPEGMSGNSAYDFFTEGYAQDDIKDGVTWEMVQDKKTIWGPLYQENITEGVMNIIPVETIGVPEVIIAEANWRSKSGAYLIRGDYIASSTTDSIAPGMIDLGHIQSIDDTISANLTEIPTVAFGFENKFVMDLGTTRQLNLKIARINPAEYDDAKSPMTDEMEYTDEDGFVIPPESDRHPGNKDKYYYSSYWSNSRWYSELRGALNFWQNSQSESGSQLGGFQIFLESPPDEETRAGDTTGLSTQTDNRPLYPSFLYNVFMTGAMSPSYDGQLLTVSLPMTLSRMITTESEVGTKDANRLCILNPGNTFPVNVGENYFYIDSIKASTLYVSMSSNIDGTWEFEAPTNINGWTCVRQYYKGNIGETIPSDDNKHGQPASLTITRWLVSWEDSNGEKGSGEFYAGSRISLGSPGNPVYMATLTATWAAVKATTILDPEIGKRYHLDDISSKEGSIEVSDDSICGSYYILKAPEGLDREKGWRINYVISGGGGRGGPTTDLGGSRNGRYLRLGGGGGSGQYRTGMANLGSDETHIAVYVGRGGGSEGASSDGNGESTRIYAIAGYTSSTENVEKVSSISNLSHRTLAIALGGNVGGAIEGGHANDENNTLIQGMAKGGKASESYDSDGEAGAKNGQLSGGLGGKSSGAITGKRQGGGGGGAGGVSFSWLLPKYEDNGEDSDKLRVYSVESTGGKGAGYLSDATRGTYGGGAGGNGSPGGNGFAVIHFC